MPSLKSCGAWVDIPPKPARHPFRAQPVAQPRRGPGGEAMNGDPPAQKEDS